MTFNSSHADWKFAAGADIGQLTQLTTNEAHERKFLSNLNGAFESFSKPLIAAVEGIAVSICRSMDWR